MLRKILHALRRWWWEQRLLSDTIAAIWQLVFFDAQRAAEVWETAFAAIDNGYMDVNACLQTKSRATLLHVACEWGHANIMYQLLQRGANPSAVVYMCGDVGQTPMQLLLQSRNIRGHDRVKLCSMVCFGNLAFGKNNANHSSLLCDFFHRGCRYGADEVTLQWLLQQRAVTSTLTTRHHNYWCRLNAVQCCKASAAMLAVTHDERCAWDRMTAMVEAEIAAQERWKPARAAWCAAVLRLRE
jgi:hypothetical protein